MSRDWTKGSTRRWRELRERVLLANAAQHQGRCRLDVGRECAKHGRPCPCVCTGTATEVHHTRGKVYGDDVRYLQAVCRACNLHVGMPGRAVPAETPTSSW